MFEYYKKDNPMFPFRDYAATLQEADGLNDILEFGPGISTRAFIEAGCSNILTLEHLYSYWRSASMEFAKYPQVTVGRYSNSPIIQTVYDNKRFDLVMVDSPQGGGKRRVIHPGQEGMSRYNTLLYGLTHAPVVLLHDAQRRDEQKAIEQCSKLINFHLTMITPKLAKFTVVNLNCSG